MENFSSNIILSNLIRIRWIAIFGQFFAIIFVFFLLNISIPLVACLCIVFISSIINTYSYFTNKIDNYLFDKEAFYFLLFDTMQLVVLLYLTGGIYNPFSLLLIAPIIISSSYLPIVYSLYLLLLSICSVVFISIIYLPIEWKSPFIVPSFFKYGLTLSLIISIFFIFIYVYLFASSSRRISETLSKTKLALADQKKISAIGSLSAAAVHELSTPLNTIFLILNDLKEHNKIKNSNDLKKEINLLKSQADRCKKILLTLSKNPEGLKDNFLHNNTLSNLVKISFDKINTKKIELKINLIFSETEPKILYKDELIFGISNIIQNAAQHAKEKITVDIYSNYQESRLIINDDGNGFKNDFFNQIGKPYASNKEFGMGLGILIAKNLLENIGSSILFKNNEDGGGSVEIIIKRVNSNI